MVSGKSLWGNVLFVGRLQKMQKKIQISNCLEFPLYMKSWSMPLTDVNYYFVFTGCTNINELDPVWFRLKIAMVQQEPTLFACSIKENIAYGKCATDEEVGLETMNYQVVQGRAAVMTPFFSDQSALPSLPIYLQ